MYGDTRPVGDAAAVAAKGVPPAARSGLVCFFLAGCVARGGILEFFILGFGAGWPYNRPAQADPVALRRLRSRRFVREVRLVHHRWECGMAIIPPLFFLSTPASHASHLPLHPVY